MIRRAPAARFLVLLTFFAGAGCRPDTGFPAADLVVETAAGTRLTYRVEVASSEEQRELGLMYRKDMAADHGMLLWFPQAQYCGIWMKNTRIPLDLLFIDPGGRIVMVSARAEPMSTRVIRSPVKVRAVLEVNGGQARERGINVGDRILYGPFH